ESPDRFGRSTSATGTAVAGGGRGGSRGGSARRRRGAGASARRSRAAPVAPARWLPRGSRTLTDQDTIVLADFTNTTGEAVFDGTLKVALAVALEQSPFLKVFPDDRVREDLRLMRHAPD